MADLSAIIPDLPVAAQAQVVVCGGGPAGLCAAVAAAQEGAQVLLVERYGFLGGMATAGLVNPFMPYYTGGKVINRGLFAEIIERLRAAGGWSERSDKRGRDAFDPEIMKQITQEMVLEAGVELLLHSFLVGAGADKGQVQRAALATKSGLQAVSGQVFIDATGDGDLAAYAGAAYEQGRPEDGLCQPMTLNFRVGGVDEDRIPSREQINAQYEAAKARGEVDNPRENVLFFYTTRPGEIHFNTTRVIKRQATDFRDLTAAELESRRQVKEMVAFLRQEVAGFEHCYLLATATQIGARESRRIVGDYELTTDDVRTTRDFADGIARGCYPIDIHNPAGTGTVFEPLPAGDSYAIPYRCLLPQGLSNLLVAGRPISADHGAHSSLRVMPIAACVGEAAGVAAAQALSSQAQVREVKVSDLRQILRDRGAVIDNPQE